MPVISGSDSRSGYLSLPPRVQLRERDSATGSYPTMARTGDPDFSGNKPVKFDDSRTVIFSDDVTVSYPTLLQPSGQSLKFITGSLASPNSGSDILATGTVRKGIADQFAFFNNSEQLGPFKEHQRVLPNSGAFYLTGTDPNVLPGFSSRLSSKTIIKIPMTVLTESSVFWSTGSAPNALGTDQGVNSGLSYFNFATGKWDVVGVDASTTTGSAVDYLNPSLSIRSGSLLCTAGGDTTNVFSGFPASYLLDFQALSGFPCSTFGFPSAQKFEASAGQKLALSDYITGPFAVEKIVFNWTGSLDLRSFNPDTSTVTAPHRATFGILNAVKNNVAQNIKSKSAHIVRESLSTVNTTTTSLQYSGSTQKDVVAFGRLQGIISTAVVNELDPKQRCEFSFQKSSDVAGGGITGSFDLELRADVPGRVLSSSMIYTLSTDKRTSISAYPYDIFQFHEWQGGRTGFGLDVNSAGRSLIKPFVGQRIISSSDTTTTAVNNEVLKTNDPSLNSFESPYVLFPEDELIFFATNQPKGGFFKGAATSEEALYANQYRWNFAPGESYVLLIGSQIRDGKEFHDTSNQPLNSDAIHEALHFDNPTVDQFQVEALNSYTGSYIDDIVSGDFTAGTRGVVGSSAAGTQGLTGSLLRGLRVTDRRERFYDTVLPDPFNYIEGLEVPFGPYTLFPLTSNTTVYSGTKYESNPGAIFYGSDGYLTSSILSYWWESFPFEPQFANVKRDLRSDTSKKSNNNLFGLVATSSFMFLVDQNTLTLSQNTLNKFWYGFGPGFLSSSISDPAVSSSFYRNYPSLQFAAGVGGSEDAVRLLSIDGYKYGVKNALPEFSTLVTRYDRYGQFRDMLEQRPDSRFSTGETTTDAPVIIRFVSPSTGARLTSPVSSSNKSEFATSSLPYFDGVARN